MTNWGPQSRSRKQTFIPHRLAYGMTRRRAHIFTASGKASARTPIRRRLGRERKAWIYGRLLRYGRGATTWPAVLGKMRLGNIVVEQRTYGRLSIRGQDFSPFEEILWRLSAVFLREEQNVLSYRIADEFISPNKVSLAAGPLPAFMTKSESAWDLKPTSTREDSHERQHGVSLSTAVDVWHAQYIAFSHHAECLALFLEPSSSNAFAINLFDLRRGV